MLVAELLRTGGVAAHRSGNAAKSVLPARTELGGVPARDPGLRSDGDRLAGGDIGRLFINKPSGTARLFATNAGAPHFRAGEGPGIRSRGEHNLVSGRGCHGSWLSLI